MAYNNYFPVNYGGFGNVGYPTMAQLQAQQQAAQQQMQAAQAQMQAMQQQTAQTNGYITVRSEEEARNYRVAPGDSITFFNETEPYCYKKTMGNSPLDKPDFKIYQIIEKQENEITQKTGQNTAESNETNKQAIDELKDEISELSTKYKALKEELEEIKAAIKTDSGKDGV